MPGLTRKRPAPVAQDEEEDVDVDMDAEDDTIQADSTQQADSGLQEMIKGLVRLALAAEYQRRPLRRQEIGEKVLGQRSRSFKKVFSQAQEELRAVFGMELVELPAKDRVTNRQKRTAQTDATKAAASYMLCSVLPAEYRTPDIIPPSAIPDTDADAQYTAIYTMLVTLVSLNNGVLSEAKMDRYLSRLNLEDNTPISGYDKTEKLLKRLEKDGYLVKARESLGTAGEEEISWVVGPRGKIEIGDAGVQGFVATVYDHPEGEEAAELTRRVERSLGVHERPAPAVQQKKTRVRTKKAAADDTDDDDE